MPLGESRKSQRTTGQFPDGAESHEEPCTQRSGLGPKSVGLIDI